MDRPRLGYCVDTAAHARPARDRSNPSRLTDLVFRRASGAISGKHWQSLPEFDTPCQPVIEINTHALSSSGQCREFLTILIVEYSGAGAKQGKHGLSCLRWTGMYVLAWTGGCNAPAICPGREEGADVSCSCSRVPGSPSLNS